MAVLGIIGSGKATAKIVTAGLDDRRALIDEDKDDFWFIVAYDGKPSASLSAALKWLAAKKTYYELVVPTRSKIDDDIVSDAAKVYKAADIYADVVKRLEDEEGDDKTLLVLYQEDDEAQDDAVRLALARSIDTLDLGNALEPFEVEEGTAEPEEEEAEPDDEDETPPAKTPASKRAAGTVPPPPAKGKPGRPRKVVEPVEIDEPTPVLPGPEEELEEAPEAPKRRTRAAKAPETAETIVASHQDQLADSIVDKFFARLAAALVAASSD